MTLYKQNIKCKKLKLFFIVLIFVVLLIPFVCMTFAQTTKLSGSKPLVEAPKLINEDGKLNIDYLPQLGKYVEDHFAFRPFMVTANALLRKNIFNESATNQVVCGKDNYLFYEGTINDYSGKKDLTDLELNFIAKNLKMIQENLAKDNINFVFTIAPNKNSLYPHLMPYNYIATSKDHNVDRLYPILDKYGVKYVDLKRAIQKAPTVQYLKEDSHWSNRGALLACNAIADKIGIDNIHPLSWENRHDRDGDIYAMLYPSIIGHESEDYAIGYNDQEGLTGNKWKFNSGKSVEDSLVETSPTNNTNAHNKSLYMYRDSFSNTLIPYLSTIYSKSIFSKLVPYDIDVAKDCKVNDVIVERTERHLSDLVHDCPIMIAPKIDFDFNAHKTLNGGPNNDCKVCEDGDYLCIKGKLDPNIAKTLGENNDSKLIIGVSNDGAYNYTYFESFCLSQDNGEACYCARVKKSDFTTDKLKLRLFVLKDSIIYGLNSYNLIVEK